MKIIHYATVLMALLVSQWVLAADLPKIVTVDLRAGVMQSEAAKLKMEQLKAEFAQEEAGIVALRNEIQEMDEQLQKDGAVMSMEQKRKMEQDIKEKSEEFKFKRQQFQQRTQAEAQEVFKSLLPKFEQALKSVVEENNIEIVLHREAALMVRPEYEITEMVMKKMDAQKD